MTRKIPILCLHGVADAAPRRHRAFTLAPERFAGLLDLLAERGYATVTVAALLRARERGESLPERVAVLTFDDGFADLLHTVVPLLVERGMIASAFVPAGLVSERPAADAWRSLTAGELREAAAAGVEIGSHGLRHRQLDLAPPAVLERELGESKRVLEGLLGRPVETIAYPYGYSSPRVRALAAELGYLGACGVKHALSSLADDPFDLARLRVLATTTRAELGAWLDGRGVRVAPCPERLVTRAFRPVRRLRRLAGEPAWP